ncbi:MAG: hypothetical protein MMC33_000393 [Icmadophila ericetorum]|nr:hypothetical protein [Icmadophila ericetorum]
MDFPPVSILNKRPLAEILTHFVYLASVNHHILNSGEPFTASGVLPLHPSAIYAPLPTAKGVTDLMRYLPPAEEAINQIALLARFNRPKLEDTRETEFLGKCRATVSLAASVFYKKMRDFSLEIRRRTFDANGMFQGMPFVWQALDPSRMPYFLSF